MSYGGACVKITAQVSYPENLQRTHTEADTLLAFHAAECKGELVVRATDTDVLIILLGMLSKHSKEQLPVKYGNIFIDVMAGDSQRFIDVTRIHSALEDSHPGITAALAGLHCFAGCDYTGSFYRKGKLMPFKLLRDEENGDEEIATSGFNNHETNR